VWLLPALLPAQNTSCALSGTVQDPAGAVVPGVKVTLTGEGNGFVRTVTTTSEGFFAFPDLTPATFTLSIDAPGFKTYRETGIAINSGEQRAVGNIKLRIGHEMALRGRDIFDAVSLLAGVVDTSDGRDGGRQDSKNTTVDCAMVLDTGSNGAKFVTLSMDGIAEAAENGRNPTSINLITKGGGTAYHGSIRC
jgi:hypothetical protein